MRILTLNDSIHRTALLAKPTIYTLGHIDVVSRRSSTPVLPLLGLNSDSTRWTDCLAQFTRNTPLLPCRIPSQSMLTTKTRTNGSFLEGIVNRVGWAEELLEHNVHPAQHFGKEKVFACFVDGAFCAFIPSLFTWESKTLGGRSSGGCREARGGGECGGGTCCAGSAEGRGERRGSGSSGSHEHCKEACRRHCGC